MTFEVIDLWPTIIKCDICNKEALLEYSIAMYEGKIVNPDRTNEWVGMPVCKDCYDKYTI